MRRLPILTAPILVVLLAAPSAKAAWTWPVSGEVITPYRNGTDPYATGQHRGIDIAAPVGATVRAAAAGDVRFAGAAGSSGLTISIRTNDGYDTSYLHLSSMEVRAGARVSAGDRIGAVGTTGSRSATAPHLHFGVRDAGTRHAYHDPLALLPPAPPALPPPEPPQPAPAPWPEPSTPRPAPVPAPAPPPAPVPAPAPPGVRGRSPAGVRERSPAPREVAHPRAAPQVRRLPRTVPRPFRTPVPSAVSGETPIVRPAYAVNADRGPVTVERRPGPSSAPPDHAMPVGFPRHEGSDFQPRADGPRTAETDVAGPDIGWALACAGLLLAAAVLGLTEDGRRAARHTRSRLLAALPALGRR